MQIKLLGTGTSQVSKNRVSASTYIKIGSKQILVDCGCGTLVRLDQAGISFKDIDIVFISHFHIDHISDLFPLIWALKHPPLNRKKKLQIIGPKGFENFYSTHIRPIVFSKHFDLFKTEIKEIKDEIKFDDFVVQAHNTLHTKESIAYKFIENNKKLVIAGDMDYDEDIISFFKNADILMLECSYGNNYKVKGHLIPKECGEIAQKANVKKLILTHLYPILKEVRLEETKDIFQNTLMAEDLMDINLE